MKKIIYYTLENSLNTKVVGHIKQLEAPVVKTYNPDSPFNFHNLSPKQFMSQDPELNVFRLFKSSKKTDFLSSQLSPYVGFFISDKVAKILRDVKIQAGKIYKLDIYTNDEKEVVSGYNFLHLIDEHNSIDFEKSVFVDFSENNKEVVLAREERDELPTFVEPQKIIFNTTPPDIFRQPYDIKVLISEYLKNKLIEENISGIEVSPFTQVEFYVD